MEWRILGLLPVMRARGPGVSRSAAERAAAEAIWVPTSLLPRFGAAWSAPGPTEISVTFGIDDHHVKLGLSLSTHKADFIVETAWPSPEADTDSRGVAVEGPVLSRRLARLRPFRYEMRCWQDGVIPDIGHAEASPQTPDERPRPRTTPARPHRSSARVHMGPRRTADRRDVELELGHLLATHPHRPTHRVNPAARRRARTRMERRDSRRIVHRLKRPPSGDGPATFVVTVVGIKQSVSGLVRGAPLGLLGTERLL
jgi:hypothetical protein